MMRCFLYARKSTDEPSRQMLSIEAQVTELREFAKKEGLTIVDEFTESMSARHPGHPIFNAIMERIEKEGIEALLAWHPDRLARNSVDGGRIIYALDSGTLSALKFPTFWFENTPQGKFMLSIAFGQSKYYVDNLSENVNRGIRQKLRRGEFPAKPPVGYFNEPRLRTIVVDEEKAPLVRRMFAEFATGKYTVKEIRDRAISWGLLSIMGGRPTLSKLYKTLANPFYVGFFRYRGELHEGSHEPLISQEVFDRVQTILKQRNVPKQRRKEPFNFLGMIECGECGCAITAEHQKKHTYYRCTRKKGPCSVRFSREEVIENQLRQATELVSLPKEWSPKLLGRVAEWKEEAASSSATALREATERLSEVERKLSRLTDLVADGVLSRDEYTPRKEKLVRQKADLVSRITAFRQKSDKTLDRLELFLKEAEDARSLAITAKPKILKAFHRKIGSNFILVSPETVPEVRNDPSSYDGSAVDARTGRDGKVFKNPPKDFIPIRFSPSRRFAPHVSTSVKSPRKIRLRGLPVLCARFPSPWNFLPLGGGEDEWYPQVSLV